MRILHVTRETAGDRRFGIGRSLDPVVAALRAAGHEVEYLTQQHLGPRALAARDEWTLRLQRWLGPIWGTPGEMLAGVWVERLNMSRLAAKVAARDGYDIVHLHDPLMGAGFRALRHAYGAGRCRWGVTQHGFGSYTQAIADEGIPYTAALMRRQLRIEAAALRAAHWVVCPTHDSCRQLARDLGLPAAAPHWHAVPHSRPALQPLAREAARHGLGWADGEWQVLAVGRINPVKRMDHIVRACLRTGRRMRLTLLGGGDPAPLHQLVAESPGAQLTLDSRVVDDVQPYLSGCDVYVSAAANESFGLANLEALACGAASICTAVGGVPEATGGAAWLLPGGDENLEAMLCGALMALQDDPRRRQALADAGLRHAASWPDAEEVGRRYESIYRRLA